jgi:hemerythrin-like domain-containing protein
MRPTQILMNEHRVIEQVLNCLETLAAQADAEGTMDLRSTREILDFLQHFADQCHHGKEEDHLFPLLEARGLPRQGGPTGVMLYEHDQGRRLIQAMASDAEAADRGIASASRHFAGHARAYVELLRAHIFKEDQRLFPMADHILSSEEQEQILGAFAHVETHHMGEGTHEKYLALADELAERLNVPRAATAVHHTCGTCGGGKH